MFTPCLLMRSRRGISFVLAFYLTADRDLARGWAARARGNIAAIQLAKELENSGRAPSEDEQRRPACARARLRRIAAAAFSASLASAPRTPAMRHPTERSALLRLPTEPYVYAEWRRCRAGIDYHVEVYGPWYSVPSRLMREAIEARITEQTVELFHRGTRVASHLRSPFRGRHTTIAEHMPSAHRRYADWTPTRLMREAAVIGPSTAALVEQILHAKPHPEQGFRACLGILRLVCAWGAERVEAACQRGMILAPVATVRSLRSCATTSTGPTARSPCQTADTFGVGST